jgi:tight adherence protein B
MVGDFIRQDLALRKEIEVKHGWIKNSAHLSAAAPWLLLLLLSTQPATAAAYATSTGVIILIAGIFMTAVAYLWMNKLGALPKPPRVFGSAL